MRVAKYDPQVAVRAAAKRARRQHLASIGQLGARHGLQGAAYAPPSSQSVERIAYALGFKRGLELYMKMPDTIAARRQHEMRKRLLDGTHEGAARYDDAAPLGGERVALAATLQKWLPNYKGGIEILARGVHIGLRARGYEIVPRPLVDNKENKK
jgi:hypothetical protein